MGENKYQNGKIYKIVDIGYNNCYIGSTCESLSQRMARHRCDFQRWQLGRGTFRASCVLFQKFGVENCKIELIEKYPCNSKEELEAREGKHQQNNDCINKHIAGRTKHQRYIDEHEYIRFQQNIHRELYPEKRKEEGKKRYEKIKHILSEKHQCSCGLYYTIQHKKRHEQSQKHQNYLKQLED